MWFIEHLNARLCATKMHLSAESWTYGRDCAKKCDVPKCNCIHCIPRYPDCLTGIRLKSAEKNDNAVAISTEMYFIHAIVLLRWSLQAPTFKLSQIEYDEFQEKCIQLKHNSMYIISVEIFYLIFTETSTHIHTNTSKEKSKLTEAIYLLIRARLHQIKRCAALDFIARFLDAHFYTLKCILACICLTHVYVQCACVVFSAVVPFFQTNEIVRTLITVQTLRLLQNEKEKCLSVWKTVHHAQSIVEILLHLLSWVDDYQARSMIFKLDHDCAKAFLIEQSPQLTMSTWLDSFFQECNRLTCI